MKASKTLAEVRAEEILLKLRDEDFEAYLFAKYPSLFYTDENGDLLPQEQRCWNDCPPGWRQILEDLFECIYQYQQSPRYDYDPKRPIAKYIRKAWNKIKWNTWMPTKIRMAIDKRLLRNKSLFVRIEKPPVKIAQFKQKWHELRVYVDNASPEIYGMIDLAEVIALKTCRSTGKRLD
jgi:hypothetical protein